MFGCQSVIESLSACTLQCNTYVRQLKACMTDSDSLHSHAVAVTFDTITYLLCVSNMLATQHTEDHSMSLLRHDMSYHGGVSCHTMTHNAAMQW